ncbi:MAG: hypothetical protein AB1697_11425 [Pseudomonadota bacterium]
MDKLANDSAADTGIARFRIAAAKPRPDRHPEIQALRQMLI